MAEQATAQVRISSLERFRRLTEELRKEVHDLAVQELNRQAAELAGTIRAIAPIYQGPADLDIEPGALKDSVRVIPDRTRDTLVRVAAGGDLTTRKSGGTSFDYARAVEFGTQEMEAKPFFFPTYRLSKKKMIAAMKRRIVASIKKRSAA